MTTKLVLPAPAKLNLFLHIIGRRADGYHELQTVFQFLTHGDELTFEVNKESPDIVLTSNVPALNNTDNLIVKAAHLLQKKTGAQWGARITLDKRLPLGGGVGGGSSDAATALLGLNALWNLHLSMEQLAELALQLGADVPVFVRGFSAFAEGIGELVQSVKPVEAWFLVLVPDVHVDTHQMYKHKDLTRDTPAIKVCAALDQRGRNDFEPLVRRLYPEVDNCLTLLDNFDESGSGQAMMSGSGACVFAPFNSREQAQAAQLELHSQAATFSSFVARGINSSPLHMALQNAGYPLPE